MRSARLWENDATSLQPLFSLPAFCLSSLSSTLACLPPDDPRCPPPSFFLLASPPATHTQNFLATLFSSPDAVGGSAAPRLQRQQQRQQRGGVRQERAAANHPGFAWTWIPAVFISLFMNDKSTTSPPPSSRAMDDGGWLLSLFSSAQPLLFSSALSTAEMSVEMVRERVI